MRESSLASTSSSSERLSRYTACPQKRWYVLSWNTRMSTTRCTFPQTYLLKNSPSFHREGVCFASHLVGGRYLSSTNSKICGYMNIYVVNVHESMVKYSGSTGELLFFVLLNTRGGRRYGTSNNRKELPGLASVDTDAIEYVTRCVSQSTGFSVPWRLLFFFSSWYDRRARSYLWWGGEPQSYASGMIILHSGHMMRHPWGSV